MNAHELLKSRKSAILISMAINIILILIGSFWFDNNYIHLELSALIILSLLLGPYAIFGFAIVEVLYWIFFLNMTDPLTIIFSATAIVILGIYPWKIWYSLKHENGFEIPNINSFYSFVKIIIVVLVMVLQTYLFTSQIFVNIISMDIESYYMLFTLGLVLLFVGIGIFGKLNIAAYTPKRQFKKIMPLRMYDLSFLLSIVILLLTLTYQNNWLLVLILILSAIFLFKPFDMDVFNVDNTHDLTIFYNAFISIFIIIIIIPTVLLVFLTMFGFYERGFASEFLNYLVILSGFFMAILIPLVIYMLFLEKQVIRPVNQLSTHLTDDITDDNDFEVLVKNLSSINVNNEIKSLSESLLHMQRDFMVYSNNLLDVTKEKERYETELKLAHEIQYSMVPTDFEEFHENTNLDIWGFMKAAREVGGDFYDYFKIDDENIGFVIGDVSGRGVPTALIMVKAMTLIRDYATYYSDLSEVFYEVNNELCKDNVEELFVGCWLGKLNTKTGELSYVNAGHKNPLIRRNGADFEFMSYTPGLLLAGMENMHYKKYTINLEPNDELFLYTDGITHANDGHGKFYDAEKLKNVLNQNKDDEPKNIIGSIENDINEFCNGQELSDDIAMLFIKMN